MLASTPPHERYCTAKWAKCVDADFSVQIICWNSPLCHCCYVDSAPCISLPREADCSPTGLNCLPGVGNSIGATLAKQHEGWQTSDRRYLAMNRTVILDLERPITLELEVAA